VIHPTNPNTMWTGSVSGGIWKTTDGGASRQILTDFMSNMAVATLVIDPANPNVLYAGTGGREFGNCFVVLFIIEGRSPVFEMVDISKRDGLASEEAEGQREERKQNGTSATHYDFLTVAGRRMMKVAPLPGTPSLVTYTSPPINSQKRRVMARPRPIPPIFVSAGALACV